MLNTKRNEYNEWNARGTIPHTQQPYGHMLPCLGIAKR